ncbi:unnamed protein product [Rotaria socialis]|uniref:rhomboid protease n=1 Tax=Rotaria socialis TaxID=392032 RepID=A0A820IJI3_9BILA|nr:unnamed protein product [Rotaria socialis]
MLTFNKTIWTKIKDSFRLPPNQIVSLVDTSHLDSPVLLEKHNLADDTLVKIDPQKDTIHIKTLSLEPHFPVFTMTIGMFNIFMLIALYIAEEGTVITSETWIKMGCKYVPCMKPLYSKTEQEIFNIKLKSQCQSFLFPYQFFRFFTPIFLHGDITHLLSNLIYQVLAGTLLEGKYGHADHAAHIGGAVMGTLVAMYLCNMPGFVTTRISNGEKQIRLLALISIIGYFVITLLIFYLFIPVHLK